MTLDQKIAVLGVIGTWVAGVATFAAVCVSLYLARRGERVQLKVVAGLRTIVGGGTVPEECLAIEVTNLGGRPVTVNSVGWAAGRRKKRVYCMQLLSNRWSAQYPIELPHGKSANFMLLTRDSPHWLTSYANVWLKDIPETELCTLVAQVHTSVGQTVEAKPEKGLLDRLRDAKRAQ